MQVSCFKAIDFHLVDYGCRHNVCTGRFVQKSTSTSCGLAALPDPPPAAAAAAKLAVPSTCASIICSRPDKRKSFLNTDSLESTAW